jgi:succinyl-CoA synthetase beta subunit
LINAFFQLARCDVLALKVAAGLERRPLGIPIVIRLRGRGLDEARSILDRHSVVFEQDLQTACTAVIAAARGPTSGAPLGPGLAPMAD